MNRLVGKSGMIKLSRTPKPQGLTIETTRKLTRQFKENKTNVWNRPDIKTALLKMSQQKCAYCEVRLAEESKYMEVEHFLPKRDYPDLVIEWTNLLPSCKRCNGKKGNFDPAFNEFIHPVEDDPKQHLVLHPQARIKGSSEKGKVSVEVLALNDYDLTRKPRLRIIHKIERELSDLYEEMTSRVDRDNSDFMKKVKRIVRAIMNAAIGRAEYSASTSSVVIHNVNFQSIYLVMKEHGVWTGQEQRLYTQMKHIALEVGAKS